eukprot:2995087-Rhodomonas_salina.1
MPTNQSRIESTRERIKRKREPSKRTCEQIQNKTRKGAVVMQFPLIECLMCSGLGLCGLGQKSRTRLVGGYGVPPLDSYQQPRSVRYAATRTVLSTASTGAVAVLLLRSVLLTCRHAPTRTLRPIRGEPGLVHPYELAHRPLSLWLAQQGRLSATGHVPSLTCQVSRDLGQVRSRDPGHVTAEPDGRGS